MAGINQGTPEVAVGEPVRLGDNGEYELEHDPITDRLIVRDTVNDKEAYVRPETNGQIGNQGAFIRSLVNGEPLADDGRTYSTIQAAEQAANGWVFVPPGTFNENVTIKTPGLTLVGAGYSTYIDGGTSSWAVQSQEENVTIQNLSAATTAGGGTGFDALAARGEGSDNCLFKNCVVRESDRFGFMFDKSSDNTITGCRIEQSDEQALDVINSSDRNNFVGNIVLGSEVHAFDNDIVANNICLNSGARAISLTSVDSICLGNFVDGDIRIYSGGVDNIVANNRVSGGISDGGTGTLLDSNKTGALN